MTAKAFVVAPQDYPRPLNVVGEHITVLANSGGGTGNSAAGFGHPMCLNTGAPSSLPAVQ